MISSLVILISIKLCTIIYIYIYMFLLFKHIVQIIHQWIVRISCVQPSRAISYFHLTKLSTSDISMKRGKLDRYTTVGPWTWVIHLRLLFDSSHGGDFKDTNQHQPLDTCLYRVFKNFKTSLMYLYNFY